MAKKPKVVTEQLAPHLLLKGHKLLEGPIERMTKPEERGEPWVEELRMRTADTLVDELFTGGGNLRYHIDAVTHILKRAEAMGFVDVRVDVTIDRWNGDYMDEIKIFGDRHETNEERLKREREARNRRKGAKEAAAKRAAQKEEEERREFERLKAKYEGDK